MSRTCSPAASELLGQQVAQAAGALDCPGPLRPVSGPFHQLAGLGCRRPHPHRPELPFRRVDRHRGMRSLVRVHSDHHSRHQQAPFRSSSRMDGPRRAPLISDPSASHLFRATPRAGPGGPVTRSKARPNGRQSHREPDPPESLNATGKPPQRLRDTQSEPDARWHERGCRQHIGHALRVARTDADDRGEVHIH